MSQAEIHPSQAPQPTQPQNIYERCKQWFIRLFQQEPHKTVTPSLTTDPTPEDPVFASELERPNTETHPQHQPDVHNVSQAHPQHQPDVRNVSQAHTQPLYAPAQPAIFATQFEGAQNFSISGNPTFTNIGVNNGVNNVNTVHNHGGVQVDNRGQRHFEINVEKQYGNINMGGEQHNAGGTYNFFKSTP